MRIPPANLRYILEHFVPAAQEVAEVHEDAGNPDSASAPTPRLIMEAMLQLLDVLQYHGEEPVRLKKELTPPALARSDIHELGDYGLSLLIEISAIADDLKLRSRSRELENLALPLGLWIARHGGELSTLEQVVNTLASLANSYVDTRQLEELCILAGEIIEATSPAISQDLDMSNPSRPWRILLLNRAILATRSHSTSLMEEAFDMLVEALPDEAPGFFRDGMEQMELLDYPPHVRNTMRRYFDTWSTRRALH